MSYSVSDLSRHISDEIIYLNKTLCNVTFEQFIHDETLLRAVTRSLEIIGEAVKKIPNDIKQRYSNTNWKEIAGMRDKLIHHYFGIDYQLVWDAIHEQLPLFQKDIEQIINDQK
ncbi:MAG: DUF86 domain-containing protein [Candidatus Kerfeldbacteria bacterium]|nr:DUF86 domain-containing protein [Candidatus Kerfeldbacteria bacterium]